MIKPDIIVTQPTHVDFPLFRYQIRQYRHLYNNVIVHFSQHHGKPDVSKFIEQAMGHDNVICVKHQPPSAKDWRDVAVKGCLRYVSSSHILFLEQDFIIKNPLLLDFVFSNNDKTIGFREPGSDRLHPAFLFITKDKLWKTSRDFGANAPEWDHFGKISKELEDINEVPLLLPNTGFKTPTDWEHIAGLTHNYSMVVKKQSPNYQPERFREYNRELLSLDIEQCPEFLSIIRKAAK